MHADDDSGRELLSSWIHIGHWITVSCFHVLLWWGRPASRMHMRCWLILRWFKYSNDKLRSLHAKQLLLRGDRVACIMRSSKRILLCCWHALFQRLPVPNRKHLCRWD